MEHMPRYINAEAAKHEARNLDTAHDALEEALWLIPNTPSWEKARRYVAIVSDMCAIEADNLREEKPS